MKQTKKPTYKELELNLVGMEYDNRELLIWVTVFLILLILSVIAIVYLSRENYKMRLQLNQTEGKNYSCDFVGAIKPEDNRNCEDESEIGVWDYSYYCNWWNIGEEYTANYRFTNYERYLEQKKLNEEILKCEVIK